MPRTASVDTYVTQRSAAKMIGVSQSRITQLISSGQLVCTGQGGRYNLSVRDVKKYQVKRIQKLIGRRPVQFSMAYNQSQLRIPMGPEDVSRVTGVSLATAKKWIGAKFRIVSIQGMTPVTLTAEVERMRAEGSLQAWRQYLNKAQHAKENLSLGDYDIDAEIQYATEQVEWIVLVSGKLNAIVNEVLAENRRISTKELYEHPPVSREDWRETHPRNPEDIAPEILQAALEEAQAELAEEEEKAAIHKRAEKIRADFEKYLKTRPELEWIAFMHIAESIHSKFERGEVGMNEEEMELKLIEVYEDRVRDNHEFLKGFDL